ncbi:MAG: hypothetical protein Q8J64_02680 [Thermodesulfovibrionales bacterium]|nr:hypothetical protein [Thermodesulfovibrionales bacterium]
MTSRTHKSMLSHLVHPLLAFLIVLGVFGLVWLRSNIVRVEYRIGMLEKEKTAALREKKALIAKRASALSVGEVQARGIQLAELSFPDRKKVFYVKRNTDGGTYNVSIRGNPLLNEQKGGNP